MLKQRRFLHYRFESIYEHLHCHGYLDYRTERSESAILLLHNGRSQNIDKHQGLIKKIAMMMTIFITGSRLLN